MLVCVAGGSVGHGRRGVVDGGPLARQLRKRSLHLADDSANRDAEDALSTLHKVEDPSAFGVVPTDADGRVEAFVEKPPIEEAPTDLINAGIYVLEPSVIDRIAEGRKVSVERETFPAMVADGTLFALQDACYWVDAGTPATYLDVQLDLIDGTRGAAEPGVHATAEVHPSAVVERSEWRSYRIQYTHPTESGALTGYLFKHGDGLYLDLTLVRGKDFGVFVVPGHVLAAVTITSATEVTLAPLSYDWFNQGLSKKTLAAALKGSRGERDQVVLGGDRAPFWQWLDGARKGGTAAAIFGAAATFRKE